jgi:hypothetical protein
MRHLRSTGIPWLRFVFLAFGLLVIVAIVIDQKWLIKRRKALAPNPTEELQAIVLDHASEPEYTDVEGLFAITPPPRWKTFAPPNAEDFDVIFRGQNDADIRVLATPVEYNDFQILLSEIQKLEKKYGINMNIEPGRFNGMRCIRRTVDLHRSKLLMIDFVTNHVAHHLEISIPYRYYDKFRPVLMDVVESYRPLAPAPDKETQTP